MVKLAFDSTLPLDWLLDIATMSKSSSIRRDSPSPDPFLTDVNTNGENTPTQEVTQSQIQSAQASAATKGSSKSAKDSASDKTAGLDAKDGGASSWGGEDMPPPPPSAPVLRRQSTSERGAQTSAFQVSQMLALSSILKAHTICHVRSKTL